MPRLGALREAMWMTNVNTYAQLQLVERIFNIPLDTV